MIAYKQPKAKHDGRYLSVPIEQRLWCRVAKSKGCWLWTGWATPEGYGKIIFGDNRNAMVTRVVYELATGKQVPKGMYVCHRCDNPRCVRPEHLFLGTAIDNARDASSKGRIAGGRRLTVETVRMIRKSRDPSWMLAQMLGVSVSTVQRARSGISWRRGGGK